MLYSYVIGWAKKYNCIVMNPYFIDYSNYFEYFKKNPFGLVPNEYNFILHILKIFKLKVRNSLERITLRSISLPYLYKIDLENEYINTQEINFSKILNGNKIVLFHGFLFGNRDFRLVENQRKFLGRIFSFSQEIQLKCSEVIRTIGKEKIIGICMRQGDYKYHFNGKFFFTDEEYKAIINKINKQFPDYSIFVACEELKDDFQLNNAVVSFQNPALNLCILSCCDLLAGPPSTFLTWAAFYQNAKVSYITKYNWDQSKYLFTTTTF
jgi:hypothetical protein